MSGDSSTVETLDISQAVCFRGGLGTDKDATFYWSTTKLKEEVKSRKSSVIGKYLKRMNTLGTPPRVARGSVGLQPSSLDISAAIKHKNADPCVVRANLCLSHRGQLLSGTFREGAFKPDESEPFSYSQPKWPCAATIPKALVQPRHLASLLLDKVNYLADKSTATPPTGLIVLAGSTKSGKSEMARAIALEAIRRNVERRLSLSDADSSWSLKDKMRLPHLITYEDPIEKWTLVNKSLLWDPEAPDRLHSLQNGFCFTPRQQGIDTASLVDALSDAKRQTPTCFYIGEVRASTDWQAIIDFAGTGHLAVVTTHASSLVELFARLLRAAKAFNPVDRQTVVSQLLACVHLQLREDHPDIGKLLVPAMWLRSGRTISSLVGDGLSAIFPDGTNILGHADSVRDALDQDVDANLRTAALTFARRMDAESVRRR
jgi:hypothetical protein